MLTLHGIGQHLLAEDIENQKIRKVKRGQELIVITRTDTLDAFKNNLNAQTGETESTWTGDWYLSNINPDDKMVTLWNNLADSTVTIDVKSIQYIIFRKAKRGSIRGLLIGVCAGGIVWAAVSQEKTQRIAAISITLVSAAYLASTAKHTLYRKYKLVGIVK